MEHPTLLFVETEKKLITVISLMMDGDEGRTTSTAEKRSISRVTYIISVRAKKKPELSLTM